MFFWLDIRIAGRVAYWLASLELMEVFSVENGPCWRMHHDSLHSH